MAQNPAVLEHVEAAAEIVEPRDVALLAEQHLATQTATAFCRGVSVDAPFGNHCIKRDDLALLKRESLPASKDCERCAEVPLSALRHETVDTTGTGILPFDFAVKGSTGLSVSTGESQ